MFFLIMCFNNPKLDFLFLLTKKNIDKIQKTSIKCIFCIINTDISYNNIHFLDVRLSGCIAIEK